jgi:uncharacterized BrkB/YihY/UPF0761 family membrane protein
MIGFFFIRCVQLKDPYPDIWKESPASLHNGRYWMIGIAAVLLIGLSLILFSDLFGVLIKIYQLKGYCSSKNNRTYLHRLIFSGTTTQEPDVRKSHIKFC